MENTTLLTTNDTGDMDPDTKLNCLQSTILLTIIVTAIVANLSVIIVILRNESLRRNSHNILILNLAVADLGTSIGSMLVSFIANFKGGLILKQHMWACSVSHIFFTFQYCSANLNTTPVSIGTHMDCFVNMYRYSTYVLYRCGSLSGNTTVCIMHISYFVLIHISVVVSYDILDY